MKENNHNTEIPLPPKQISATNILSRLLDGLTFRYYWATQKLTDSDLQFQPVKSSMSLEELVQHIYNLICVTDEVLNNKRIPEKRQLIQDFDTVRSKTLELLNKNSKLLLEMEEGKLSELTFKSNGKSNGYSFWYLINGPLADALTHIGQINSWRRINGNPITMNNPFIGK